jgi:hypothetical protein
MKKQLFYIFPSLLLIVHCSLEMPQEEIQWDPPYYLLTATGFGDHIDIEFIDSTSSVTVVTDEFQGDGWWQYKVLQRDLNEHLSGTRIYSLIATNSEGGPVAAKISKYAMEQVNGTFEGPLEELLIIEDSAIGSVKLKAELDVPTPSFSVNLCPGCTGPQTVICSELYRQGLMSYTVFRADQAFGRNLAKNDKYILLGYHFWAKPIVKIMQKSKMVTKIVCVVAKPWSLEMAYEMGAREKGTVVGKILMFVGIPVCRIIGKAISGWAVEGV